MNVEINTFKHELGLKAKDVVSGFEGIIVSRVQHLTGCSTYGLAPRISESGEVKSTEYFDEDRIEILGPGIPWEGAMAFDEIFMHPIGAKAREKVTGFTGTITTRIEYMYGANGVGITPPMDKEGKLPDVYQFDEGRVEILKDSKVVSPKEVASPTRGAMVNRDAPKL